MTSHVHAFDAREGGEFRVSLTYDAPTGTGKTTAQTDTYHGRFTRLVPDTEVVQVVEFESPDPALGGEMTITYALADAGDGGTVLTGTHENLPPGVRPEDNELGWSQSIGKLARLVEEGAGADERRASVASSRTPPKCFASTSANTRSCGAAAANSVIDERSFIASTGPKMSSAVLSSVPATMRAHSVSRGPSTGWFRYARASVSPEIAYRWDVALNPRPATCGKTNHIQWLTFRPARSSATARW